MAGTAANPAHEVRAGWYLIGAVAGTGALVAASTLFGTGSRRVLQLSVAWPGIFACILVLLRWPHPDRQGFAQGLTLGPRRGVWVAISVLVFPVLALLAVTVAEQFGHMAHGPPRLPPVSRIAMILILAAGEEVGWRGCAQQQLTRTRGPVAVTLIIGLVWALWHVPGSLVGFGAPSGSALLAFGLWVVAASFVFTQLYLASGGSVWTAVGLHFGANVALQSFRVEPVLGDATAPFTWLLAMTVATATALGLRWLLQGRTPIVDPDD